MIRPTLAQSVCCAFLVLNVGMNNGNLVYGFVEESMAGWVAGFTIGCIGGLGLLGVVLMGGKAAE